MATSRKIITQKADFSNERLFDQNNKPLYPFPDPDEFKGMSCDSNGIGPGYRKYMFTKLGELPGSDTGNKRFEDNTTHNTQPWKYVTGENVIDLFIDGGDGSPADNQKNLNHCCGYEYLLSADAPGDRPSGNQSDLRNGKSDTTSLFVSSAATFNSVSHPVGWYIGSPRGCHEITKARWCCPVGIQFSWDDKASTDKPNTANEMHRYKALYFVFQERNYYKAQYAPLIWDYKPQDDQGLNYYAADGDRIYDKRQHPVHEGFNRYFLRKKDIEYLKKNRCALVGMGARMTYEDSAGTSRWHAERFWNVKFLFDTVEHPNSHYIWQEPTTMYDYLEAEQYKIA